MAPSGPPISEEGQPEASVSGASLDRHLHKKRTLVKAEGEDDRPFRLVSLFKESLDSRHDTDQVLSSEEG